MRLKTFCFNKTLFRKNATRFAPVWLLYTVCLLGALGLGYSSQGDMRAFSFTESLLRGSVIQGMGVVNLLYAPLVVQLLFGDLYNSRMCNAIHSLPMRREDWFFTNVLSGLCFSLVPTLAAALMLLPLLSGSIFVGAWKVSFQLFAAVNLEYLCFFGLATFAAMCVGNRFTMIAGYGLLNTGAVMAQFLVDSIYTPMLYGVRTPNRVYWFLTPLDHMVNAQFYETTDFAEIYDRMEATGAKLESLTATYTMQSDWWRLVGCAAVGIALIALALLLYRKRHLECAGDAVAFPVLVPVFQVLCALFVMVGIHFVLGTFFSVETREMSKGVILTAGLVIGWIVGRMLIERSTQVFRLKNFYGLIVLAAALGLSLLGTYLDVFHIETRLPKAEKVERVYLETNQTMGMMLEEPEQIEDMIRIQSLTLENRAEEGYGLHVRGNDGSWVYVVDSNDDRYDTTEKNPEFTYVANVGITYWMKNGSTMERRYNIYTESEEGALVRKYVSSWDYIAGRTRNIDGEEKNELDTIMEHYRYLNVSNYAQEVPDNPPFTEADARSFLEAVKADCAAGTIAQDDFFHKDLFRNLSVTTQKYDGRRFYEEYETVRVSIYGGDEEWSSAWYIGIYPDSENCVRWLREHGALEADITPNTSRSWIAYELPKPED